MRGRTMTSKPPSRASRPPPARCSRCCHPTTRPAISPRSCSGYRCASVCRTTSSPKACCGRECRSWSMSIRDPSKRAPTAAGCRSPRRPSLSIRHADWRGTVMRQFVAAPPVSVRSPSSGTGGADVLPLNRLLAFVVMCFGMFMAILDIQIVSASLTEIQAGLSAPGDEIPWVQTAYLIAEVIAIPLSGFLSRALGTRVLFTVSAAGFTLSSFMCGFASSIDSMILWRAVQGFIGGGVVPPVFGSAYILFPGRRQAMVAPIIGLIATLAPTVGPTIGGYVTDALSWHWLFFINIAPGVVVTLASYLLIDFDKPDYSLLENFDWWGLISMAGVPLAPQTLSH